MLRNILVPLFVFVLMALLAIAILLLLGAWLAG
jgi:hypothetical protein